MNKFNLKKFNLACESTELNLIFEAKTGLASYFEKKWSLHDEFEAIIPIILSKLIKAVGNFYSPGKPGEPVIAGDVMIEPF